MHTEFLVEDLSGENFLNEILPKLVHEPNSYRVHPYKGIGHIPKDLKTTDDAKKRILLENLPKILRGYNNMVKKTEGNYKLYVFLVCDLDKKCFKKFRNEILQLKSKVAAQLDFQLCFAIEEGEAWLLGDKTAIKLAFPNAKDSILGSYKYDSICNTWELLADALEKGGASKLKENGYKKVGEAKSNWAIKIGQKMDLDTNKSKSFCYFLEKVKEKCNT